MSNNCSVIVVYSEIFVTLNFREKLQNRIFAFNFCKLHRLSQLKCRGKHIHDYIFTNRNFLAEFAKISDYTVFHVL